MLAHLCWVWNNHSTSKRWLIWPACHPPACFPPLTTLCWLCCSWLERLPPASPDLWCLAVHLLEWWDFLRWVALQVRTWKWPPICLTCSSRCYDWKSRSWAFTSAAEIAQSEMIQFYFPAAVSNKHVNRLWATFKVCEPLFSVVLEEHVAVGNSRFILVSSTVLLHCGEYGVA